MAVDEMTWEKWDKNINRGGSRSAPRWDEVEEAVEQLDGRTHTLVTLEGGGRVLMVGGGAARRYVVVATEGDESWSLSAGSADGPMVEMVVGGQRGEYRADIVVGLEAAKDAARFFFERNALDFTRGWVKD